MQRMASDEWHTSIDIELYDRYAPTILAYIYQQLSSAQDAEDVLIDVFMAALQQNSLSHLSAERQLAWLRRVAHNKIIDRYRRRFSHAHALVCYRPVRLKPVE